MARRVWTGEYEASQLIHDYDYTGVVITHDPSGLNTKAVGLLNFINSHELIETDPRHIADAAYISYATGREAFGAYNNEQLIEITAEEWDTLVMMVTLGAAQAAKDMIHKIIAEISDVTS